MQILVSIGAVGASPQIGEILPLVTFLTVLSCPYLFSRSAPRSNRWTDFHALWLRRRVSAQGWSFWGLERWVTILGKICPHNPPKMCVNRQCEAKTGKIYKSQYLQNYNSNMAAGRFPKPEVVISQPWIELSHRNLVCT